MDKPNKIQDGWLIEKYQSGHKSALTVLVKRWHVKFCKQAYWYTNDFDIAKDIAQDSWNVILCKLDTLNDPNKFGSWALSIVNRKSIDWIRKQKKTKNDLDTYGKTFYSESDYEDDDEKGKNITVLNAIKELPENQQMVLKLFYLESYSIIQISKLLKVSKGTVKSRLFYAREKLKTIIKHKDYE